jgi:hypothetical protein
MPALVLFDEFKGELGKGTHQLNSHVIKLALSNTAPDAAANDELADITQIAATGGYVAGGQALDSVVWEETGAGTGIWRLVSADEVFTASGAAIPTFRYGVLYNDTSTGDKLIGYIDYGAAVNIADGSSFTFDVNASNGWLQLNDA